MMAHVGANVRGTIVCGDVYVRASDLQMYMHEIIDACGAGDVSGKEIAKALIADLQHIRDKHE